MRRLLFLTFFIFAFTLSSQAQDEAYTDAIGIRGGPLTGITYKRFFWPVNGVFEGIAGFNFLNGRTASFTGLYEYHLFINYNINVYGGGGTTIAFNANDFRWIAEGIVGIELLVDTLPILISVDIKPGWSILDSDLVLSEAALSVRYILHK